MSWRVGHSATVKGEKQFKGTNQPCFQIMWNHQAIYTGKSEGSSFSFSGTEIPIGKKQ
jgi:hypothetical protein